MRPDPVMIPECSRARTPRLDEVRAGRMAQGSHASARPMLATRVDWARYPRAHELVFRNLNGSVGRSGVRETPWKRRARLPTTSEAGVEDRGWPQVVRHHPSIRCGRRPLRVQRRAPPKRHPVGHSRRPPPRSRHRHSRRAQGIYRAATSRSPRRWSGDIRDPNPVGTRSAGPRHAWITAVILVLA